MNHTSHLQQRQRELAEAAGRFLGALTVAFGEAVSEPILAGLSSGLCRYELALGWPKPTFVVALVDETGKRTVVAEVKPEQKAASDVAALN